MLNNIYYDRVVKDKKQIPNIFILLVALNDFSKRKLEKVPSRMLMGNVISYISSPFKLLFLQDRLYTPLIIKLGFERYFNINVFFSLYTINTPYISIYLDHKIADEPSTYKDVLLYGPIVPGNYDYESYMNYGGELMYDFVPANLTTDEESKLISDFNSENNTTFRRGQIPYITLKLLSKLKIAEQEIDKTLTRLNFKPFINNCNKNEELLKIITDEDIINCDYMLFMAPKGCIENKDCAISDFNVEYFKEKLSFNEEEIKRAIEISNKIKSYACPISWYKKGNFQMTCRERCVSTPSNYNETSICSFFCGLL